MSLYSVVVPVYNSEHTLQELYTRLEKVFREVIKEEFELILVDDGSKDRSFEVMQELRAKDNRVRIIQMARNFGQHPALLCGFAHVKGDFVVTMDDDLQHQPEELPKMINVMRERDDVDAIIASYEGRQHGFIRKLGTKFSVWAHSSDRPTAAKAGGKIRIPFHIRRKGTEVFCPALAFGGFIDGLQVPVVMRSFQLLRCFQKESAPCRLPTHSGSGLAAAWHSGELSAFLGQTGSSGYF